MARGVHGHVRRVVVPPCEDDEGASWFQTSMDAVMPRVWCRMLSHWFCITTCASISSVHQRLPQSLKSSGHPTVLRWRLPSTVSRKVMQMAARRFSLCFKLRVLSICHALQFSSAAMIAQSSSVRLEGASPCAASLSLSELARLPFQECCATDPTFYLGSHGSKQSLGDSLRPRE